MQKLAQFDVEALDDKTIRTILAPFKGRHVQILVKEVNQDKRYSQSELYQKALEVRERFKNAKIDPDLNLSDLANEVNL